MAALIGAGAYGLAAVIGGSAGGTVVLVLLLAVATVIYLRSRQAKVDQSNVNAEWTGALVPEAEEPAEPVAAGVSQERNEP